MFGLGVQELLIILVIGLIFFGADKIPQLARSLGKGMNEFRKAQQELKAELLEEQSAGTPPGGAQSPAVGNRKPTYAICPSCKGKTVEGSLYCANCGLSMTVQPVCAVCQRSFMGDEKFCPKCGKPRMNPEA